MVGLLLADLLKQGGSDQAAMNLYGQLAREDINDAKPLLAVAPLRQKRGDEEAVHTLLEQVQEKLDAKGRIDLLIDAVAGQLGLSAARSTASEEPSAMAFQGGSDRP